MLISKKSPFITRVFSHLRDNAISWLPFEKGDNVLIIGSGFGIFTKFLSSVGCNIYCMENDKLSVYINYWRNIENSNVMIFFEADMESVVEDKDGFFHYIIFASPITLNMSIPLGENRIFQKLKTIKRKMRENGKIIYMSGNRMGMKFWSGCKDELTGGFFSGIEGYYEMRETAYPNLSEIKQMLRIGGFPYNRLYFPYPDYVYPTSIYSEDVLPQEGDLTKNAFSWEERIMLFNEVAAFNNVIKMGEFPLFTNSFLVVSSMCDLEELNAFIKYSNDRSEEFSIRTDICIDANGKRSIRKVGLTDEAIVHLKNMMFWKTKMEEMYGSQIAVNKYEENENGLSFEFIHGESLQNILIRYLEYDDYKNFENWIMRFYKLLLSSSKQIYVETPEFRRVFGNVDLPKGLLSSTVSNIDMIFSNILIDEKKINVIDYEWVFDFCIPTKFVLFRSLFMLFHGPRGKYNFNKLYLSKILKKLDIDEKLYECFIQMESNFQKYVCGAHVPLRMMCNQIPTKLSPRDIQVFFSYGEKFCRINSCYIGGAITGRGKTRTRIALTSNVTAVRIDPAEQACIVKVNSITDNQGNGLNYLVRNGKEIANNIIISASNDIQIIVENVNKEMMFIDIDLEVNLLNEEACEQIIKQLV